MSRPCLITVKWPLHDIRHRRTSREHGKVKCLWWRRWMPPLAPPSNYVALIALKEYLMGFTECSHLRAKLFTLHKISESSKQMALEVVELLKCQENKPSLRPSLSLARHSAESVHFAPTPPERKRLNVCRCRVLLTNWRNFRWQHKRLYLVYKIKLQREIFSVVQRKVASDVVQFFVFF